MIEGDKMIEETNQEVVSENTGDAVENLCSKEYRRIL
jgi:hypothetical protein